VASIAYLLLIAVVVGWLLKVHNCSSCVYYGEWCHLGWGKYAALICRRDSGNPETGAKLTAIYPLLTVIPILGGIAALLLNGFSWVAVGLMVGLAALSGVQAVVLRPKGCAHCKQRHVCPGNAAKA
jgi:hypothetical protein